MNVRLPLRVPTHRSGSEVPAAAGSSGVWSFVVGEAGCSREAVSTLREWGVRSCASTPSAAPGACQLASRCGTGTWHDRNRDGGARSSGERVKGIKLVTNDPVSAWRWVGACAIAHGLRVVSYNERRSWLSTKLEVVVSGHPRYIRGFHDDVRGDGWSATGGDLLGFTLVYVVVSGVRAVRRSWHTRRDPPLGEARSESAVASPQTIVFWSWRPREDGDAVGPFGSRHTPTVSRIR